MLQFPEGYFQEETRWNFRVSKTMKHAWAAQLEVLQKIYDICQKHGLICYAFWGTLLGAVRHEGFIPWDDDLDFAFKREDYIKFLQVAKKELPSEYCILNAYTQEEWEQPFTRVTNSHGIDTSEIRLLQYHGCPFVVGVDIFALDYFPRDEGEAEIQKTLLNAVWKLRSLAKDIQLSFQESKETLESGLVELEEYCKISIDRDANIANQLLILYDRICAMYGEKEGDMLASYADYADGFEHFLFRKECFGVQQMKFENMMIIVPSGYDEILTQLFGDYMTPVQNTAGHDYPFYKEQLQTMHERGIWLDVKE